MTYNSIPEQSGGMKLTLEVKERFTSTPLTVGLLVQVSMSIGHRMSILFVTYFSRDGFCAQLGGTIYYIILCNIRKTRSDPENVQEKKKKKKSNIEST